ncbi:MAG: sensor histidine kinase [Actinomycetota bacterium]
MTAVISGARRYTLDGLIALAAVGGVLDVVLRNDALAAPRTTHWILVPGIALVVLPLLGRRNFPFAAPASVWLLAAAISFIDGRLIVFAVSAALAGLAAAFMLGNLGETVQARIGLVIVLCASLTITYNDPHGSVGDYFFTPMLFGLAWLTGYTLRERGARAELAERRATLAELEAEVAARLAVAEERARIARELHDIVAHAVSVMVLQIGAVRHKLPHGLEEDKDALEGVERAGRSALGEMRRLLGAMRDDGQDPELTPQAGLDDLDALLEQVGHTRLPVELHVQGDRFPLPRAIDLSAYRIIQEGLTNVLKHAHADRADVTICYKTNEATIEIRDDGRGAVTTDGLGHGLVGVRERVKIYGGEMTTGTPEGGGFILRARLPLSRERP